MMCTPWTPQFLYAVCQRGAEAALKREVKRQNAGLQPAFSRPGFVTFKLTEPCTRPESFAFVSTFARAWGFSLGKISGDRSQSLAKQVWELPELAKLLAPLQQESVSVRGLHVWQRDSAMPGQRGFEPGPTPLAKEVEQVLRSSSPIETLRQAQGQGDPRQPAPRGSWVLDVVLVEPNEWWVGCHLALNRVTCHAGGVIPLSMPTYAVSRAYLKMAEALRWSAIPITRGDQCVELGCAPGGAAQALLDCGLYVTGVDPAEVDPEVADHPRFTHLRRRSADLPRRQLRGVRWLVADMNVAPNYTLDAVETIVTHQQVSIRGMVLTLKLADWKLADELPRYVERVRGWGYQDVRTRQLAHNRQELCLIALRNRSQRRVRRNSRRHLRHDPAHASTSAGSHLASNM